jgi:hypothetical protein
MRINNPVFLRATFFIHRFLVRTFLQEFKRPGEVQARTKESACGNYPYPPLAGKDTGGVWVSWMNLRVDIIMGERGSAFRADGMECKV